MEIGLFSGEAGLLVCVSIVATAAVLEIKTADL